MSPVSPSWTDPVGAAAFYCHGDFHTGQRCCHHSCWALPGAGARCSLESITHASTCPSHRKNVPATPCKGQGPAAWVAPRGGTEVLWAGCSWRWFSSFPLWSQLLLSQHGRGSDPVTPGLFGPDLVRVSPQRWGTPVVLLRCHPLSPGSRSLCGRRSCAIPDPRRRARSAARPAAAHPPSRWMPEPWERCGHPGGAAGGFQRPALGGLAGAGRWG